MGKAVKSIEKALKKDWKALTSNEKHWNPPTLTIFPDSFTSPTRSPHSRLSTHHPARPTFPDDTVTF